jgi:peptidylprolyl isomerase
MREAQDGDRVAVHYTGKFTDGSVFDSSQGQEPLRFTIGAQEVIPGFERAVIGMSPGQTKTQTIPSDQAYGPHSDEMVLAIDRKEFPSDLELEVGRRLKLNQEGQNMIVTITDVNESSITLDANHPLAGQDLVFDIELVEIGEPLSSEPRV